jgi:4-hydroxy-2-oxoheptanedioate aldolase
MTGQEMRRRLHAGERVYGSALTNASAWAIPNYPELDFVFIDNEHCPLGRESTMTLCQGYKAHGVVPVVRIPIADPILACKTIDAGANGIICPYMEDPGLVREMVGAVKYRPLKGEKLSAFLKDGSGVEPVTLKYLNKKNKDNILIINVESVPAMNRLEELVAVDGLDAVLIGPNDLSISLNIPDEFENPKFIAAAEKIIATARAAGIGGGIHYWDSFDRERQYVQKGANLIVHASDVGEAAKAINGALGSLRKEFGDVKSGAASESEVI